MFQLNSCGATTSHDYQFSKLQICISYKQHVNPIPPTSNTTHALHLDQLQPRLPLKIPLFHFLSPSNRSGLLLL